MCCVFVVSEPESFLLLAQLHILNYERKFFYKESVSVIIVVY
jgi:hypothetical protein